MPANGSREMLPKHHGSGVGSNVSTALVSRDKNISSCKPFEYHLLIAATSFQICCFPTVVTLDDNGAYIIDVKYTLLLVLVILDRQRNDLFQQAKVAKTNSIICTFQKREKTFRYFS